MYRTWPWLKVSHGTLTTRFRRSLARNEDEDVRCGEERGYSEEGYELGVEGCGGHDRRDEG